jgi:hypothetical protein
MPLTKGLRDEENERINTILKQLIALTFVPEMPYPPVMATLLGQLGLAVENLYGFPAEELIAHLQKLHVDWENAEQFADFLIQFGANNNLLNHKAISIYEYIQTQSQTFSFGIFNKIAAAKRV